MPAAEDAGGRRRSGVDRRRLLAGGLAAATIASVGPSAAQVVFSIPPEAIGDMPPAPSADVVETLHGVTVADPFRPFESPGRDDVKAWVAAHDRRTLVILEQDPLHARIASYLKRAAIYPRSGLHRRIGTTYFSLGFDGIAEQSWLDIRTGANGQTRRLIDPNQIDPEGLTALAGYVPDRIGSKVAWLATHAGGDSQVLRIRDISSGLDLLDRLDGCRFTSIAWLPDGNSFYYTRPPLAGEGGNLDPTSHGIYWHRLGYPQSTDRLLLSLRNTRNTLIGLRAAYATNQLIITTRRGTSRSNGYLIAPITDATLATTLLREERCSFAPIRNLGPMHYAITDLDASRARIVRMALISPHAEAWQTIVPEGDGVIDGARLVGNRLLVRRLVGFGHSLTLHDLNGAKRADVELPRGTRVELGNTEPEDREIEIQLDDRRQPARIERLEITTGKLTLVRPSASRQSLTDVVIREGEARAPDGTRVPVSLMHLPGLAADASNRTLLTGYGGFGVPQLPAYNSTAAAWLRLGGVYAVAHIRGGGEHGRDWAEQARARRRQTGFDDFRAAAEWLFAERITRPDRLGIYGASNGGLLVLAAMLQRPEHYGAVVSAVPVADMIRFPQHTFGVAWKPEYGDPDNAADFAALMAYSPLHNVKAGAKYPPLLILTAENDQRVVPSHAYKLAATMMSRAPDGEVYVRTRRGAGHGGGNGLSKIIEHQADIMSFLISKLGGPIRDLPSIGN